MSKPSYESFPKKEETICEKLIKYCKPPKSPTVKRPITPQLKRHRRIYHRNERSTPDGEIHISEFTQESTEEET